MPRTSRAPPGGCCYHVLNRGNAHAEVFHKEADFQAFLEILAEASLRHPMRLLAYCLIPNHFHLALWPTQDGDLSRCMHWLLTTHAAPLSKALPLQRAHLARPLQVISNPGRRPSPGRAALHRAEPAAGEAGGLMPRTGPGPASKRCRTRPRRRCGSIPARRALGAEWIEAVNATMFEAEVECVRESIRRDRPWVTRPGRWRPQRTWVWTTACIPGVVRPGPAQNRQWLGDRTGNLVSDLVS